MATDSRTSDIDRTRQQVAALIREIEALAKRGGPPEEFYPALLERGVAALAAAGAAVWSLNAEGNLELAHQWTFPVDQFEEPRGDVERHGELVRQTWHQGQARLVSPSLAASSAPSSNPTRYLLVLAPVRVNDQTVALIEVFQRPVEGAAQQGYLRFVEQLGALAANWALRRQALVADERGARQVEMDAFARAVHESLDVARTSHAIADTGRNAIGCDRLSVAFWNGARCTVRAVSGQEEVEPRSDTIVRLNQLATRVARSGEPLWYSGDVQDLPPPLADVLEKYVNASSATAVAIVPLHRPVATDDASGGGQDVRRTPASLVGALILERFHDNEAWRRQETEIDFLRDHSARALGNALEHDRVFLLPLWLALGNVRRIIRSRAVLRGMAWLGVLAGILALLALAPMDDAITAQGSIQPKAVRHVFAGVEGTVSELHVESGDSVKPGDLLATMTNPTLARRLDDVEEQLAGLQADMESLTEILSSQELSDQERARFELRQNGLAHRQAQLELEQRSLADQLDQLVVTSPSAGRVSFAGGADALLHRPLHRGGRILVLEPENGPWQLHLWIAERDAYRIERARQEAPHDLAITFAAGFDEPIQGAATLARIHRAAEPHDELGRAVRIDVDISGPAAEALSSGASATARIKCGRASLGAVALRELVEFFRNQGI